MSSQVNHDSDERNVEEQLDHAKKPVHINFLFFDQVIDSTGDVTAKPLSCCGTKLCWPRGTWLFCQILFALGLHVAGMLTPISRNTMGSYSMFRQCHPDGVVNLNSQSYSTSELIDDYTSGDSFKCQPYDDYGCDAEKNLILATRAFAFISIIPIAVGLVVCVLNAIGKIPSEILFLTCIPMCIIQFITGLLAFLHFEYPVCAGTSSRSVSFGARLGPAVPLVWCGTLTTIFVMILHKCVIPPAPQDGTICPKLSCIKVKPIQNENNPDAGNATDGDSAHPDRRKTRLSTANVGGRTQTNEDTNDALTKQLLH